MPLCRAPWIALVLCVTLGVAACKRRVPPEEQVDGWKLARAALTSGEHCLAGRPEYCLTDPELVDAAIRPRLVEIYGGEMPLRRAHVEAVIRAAATRYKREALRPENTAKIEELVSERYHAPVVTVTDDVVSIDMGVVPGMLEPHTATLSLTVQFSHVLDRGEWKRAELERVMLGALEKYPDHRTVRIALLVPTERGLATLSYRYLRPSRTLVVTDWRADMRTTRRLTGPAALKDPDLSLRFFDLSPCEPSRLEAPLDQDPPKLCPADFDPARGQPAEG